MMKKRYLSISVFCVAAIAMLSGCVKSHVHQSDDAWKTDLNKHWKTCTDCSQILEESEHTMDDSETCIVCGAQIIDWGDKQSVSQYNENGDPLKMADYDSEGNVITETVYDYGYDTDGKLIHSMVTTDGTLTEESTYTIVEGESLISQWISYMEDGSKVFNTYDTNGNVIQMISYDSDGKIDLQTDSEYSLSEDRQWYESKCTTIQEDGSKVISEFSENGDQISAVSYDADDKLCYQYVWEYTYDENGNWKTMKYYCDDVLNSETIYATKVTTNESTTYPETVTVYEADGSKTKTVYDAEENIISQTHYDANGKVTS